MRVSSIYGSYHHRVGASLFDHPVEIHKRRCVGPNQLLSRLHSLAVDIAKPYDFHDVAIAFHDLLPPSKGAASTGTDEGHPQPSLGGPRSANNRTSRKGDRKSTRLNSSHVAISYAVFCLKKKK